MLACRFSNLTCGSIGLHPLPEDRMSFLTADAFVPPPDLLSLLCPWEACPCRWYKAAAEELPLGAVQLTQRRATYPVTALILGSVENQALGCGSVLAPMSGLFGRLL